MTNAQARGVAAVPDGSLSSEPANFAELPQADTLTPADRYQELFVEIQMQQIYPDGKIFVDSSPKAPPEQILESYRRQCEEPAFDLGRFAQSNFEPQHPDPADYVAPAGRGLREHIDALWDIVSRRPDQHPRSSSLLPLPRPYVIPGGRFCEIYYWDTCFTMIGLAASRRLDLMHAMADNFAYLIGTYGHVPNGNRTYYLGRSQPPLFAYIVELFEEHEIRRAVHYLPMLKQEHAYWMQGAALLKPGEQRACVVRLPDGALLNRYWDERDVPREQSYREDILTARRSMRPAHEVFRDTRAGAACGWDFSSRWFDDPQDIATIRTTKILPVDLNCFLHKLETVIAELCRVSGDERAARGYLQGAQFRAEAIQKYFWNEELGAYLDYDWQRGEQRPQINAATVTPLFRGLASAEQADRVAQILEARLLSAGGLGTTLVHNGQQWDQPNGWAPLQWIAIRGLKRYGYDRLADLIAHRWLNTVASVFSRHGKLVEKYDLQAAAPGDGGEYPLQDGFGWTNGVTRVLLDLYPEHPASAAVAGSG